jgi:hypothetical protein
MSPHQVCARASAFTAATELDTLKQPRFFHTSKSTYETTQAHTGYPIHTYILLIPHNGQGDQALRFVR